jgi:hypothetical protein
MTAILVVWSARNMEILYKISHTSILQSNNSLCFLVSEEIFLFYFSQSEKRTAHGYLVFCLDEMRKSYRGTSIDASCKTLLNLSKRFQRRRILEIAYCIHVCYRIGTKWALFLQRTFHRCYLPMFVSFGHAVSEKKIQMWNANRPRMTDNGYGPTSWCVLALIRHHL